MTLAGWLLAAVLAIAYIHYYRKGRFGFTRGATAAVFSHIALMFFFVGFPLTLVVVLVGNIAAPGLGTAQEPTEPRPPQQPAQPDAALPFYTDEGARAYEPHIVDRGLAAVITDATAPEDLRAVFDAQYGDLRDAGHDPQLWEVQIRCASVPELPDADPTLATGWFVTSRNEGIYSVADLRALADQATAEGDRRRARWATDYAGALEEAGLASNADFVFETTERKDCDPLPLPSGAATPETVIAAAQRAGLEVTNPRDGTNLCHALGCVQRTVTDQFNIVVWPTADMAQAWARSADDPSAAEFGAVAGVGPAAAGMGPIGLFLAATVPSIRDVVVFDPLTTAHLVPFQLEERMAMAGDNPDDEQTRYKNGLASAAEWLERTSRG
jgi:hypothetical protein